MSGVGLRDVTSITENQIESERNGEMEPGLRPWFIESVGGDLVGRFLVFLVGFTGSPFVFWGLQACLLNPSAHARSSGWRYRPAWRGAPSKTQNGVPMCQILRCL